MANEEQLNVIYKGKDFWNNWRTDNLDKGGDFYSSNFDGADLSGMDLSRINLSRANLYKANLKNADLRNADLSWTYLHEANLRGAKLSGANLYAADLCFADLTEADLEKANLEMARLNETKLCSANLHGAILVRAEFSNADLYEAVLTESDLSKAILVESNLEATALTGSKVYAISAWGLKYKTGEKDLQRDLTITPSGQPVLTADNLEVAQFIYLLLHNEKIRDVIGNLVKKAVLILGRFTQDRKVVLDAIKKELRNRGYLPVLFDFEKSEDRDIGETVSTLAHMARFIIADITDAKTIPAELQKIVPELPSVPVMVILLRSDPGYAMIESILRHPQVIRPPYQYKNESELLALFEEKVIGPAERKVNEMTKDLEKIREDLSNIRKSCE